MHEKLAYVCEFFVFHNSINLIEKRTNIEAISVLFFSIRAKKFYNLCNKTSALLLFARRLKILTILFCFILR
jgi:hypothetical protein